jgi:hypothetical protein
MNAAIQASLNDRNANGRRIIDARNFIEIKLKFDYHYVAY